jgi:hypothetical protein
MWAYHKFLVVGPMRYKHGHGSAIYDHLQRRHIRWMVMAHHVSHYEKHFHLQTMHFQFGVIKAICNLR